MALTVVAAGKGLLGVAKGVLLGFLLGVNEGGGDGVRVDAVEGA